MRLPKLTTVRRAEHRIERFGGLNRQAAPSEGEFADMRGLSSDACPAVTLPAARYRVSAAGGADTFIFWCGGLIELVPQESGADRLYYRGEEVTAWRSGGLSRFSDVGELSKISAASIGSFVLFAPYRAWFNVETGECGSMVAGLTVGPNRPGSCYIIVKYDDLTDPTHVIEGDEGDDPPSGGDCLDGTAFVAGDRVYRYYSRKGEWREIDRLVYRFYFLGAGPLPLTVTEGGEATVTGLSYTYVGAGPGYETEVRSCGLLTGKATVGKTGSDSTASWVDLPCGIDVDILLSSRHKYEDQTRIDVTVVSFGILGECPDLAYVCASENRIWGCDPDGREICACALGDPRRWYPYGGGAGDPWAATVGDGSGWTGAVTYRGRPCFFKSDRLIRVNGAKPSNFGYTVFSMQGAVCPRSFAVVSDRLFYVGADGVYVWSGGLAERISDKAGGVWAGADAVGAGFGGKYYVWRGGADGELLVYDVRLGVWNVENDGRWLSAARAPDDLYYTAAVDGGVYVCSFLPKSGASVLPTRGWFMETGELLRGAGGKYLSRVELTASLENGASCTLYVKYSGDSEWKEARVLDRLSCAAGPVPFTPRRCGSFRLKLAGNGRFTLYAITYYTEEAREYG